MPLFGPVALGTAVLVALRWRMNVMSLPDEEARALGVPTGPLRIAIVAAATLVTSASVATAGIIGWVGLVVPHLARALVGPDFARLLPTAALLGGGFLLLIDTLARTMAPIEIPLGILTAVVGTPFFIWLLASVPRTLVVTLLEAATSPSATATAWSAAASTSRSRHGEVLALLGPNGGGKTTLLKTLLGLLAPQAGEVQLDGRPLARYSIRERARRIAYVPQVAHRDLRLHRRDRRADGPHRARQPVQPADARTTARWRARALERFGIAHLAERPYTMISGGERQLVLLARALAQEPQFIVLDEPTASLDFGNQGKVMREIRALAASGHGVLFTTHDPNHALRAADRAFLLREGARIAEGAVGAVLNRAQLEALYGAPVETLTDPTTGATAFLPG